MGAFNTTQFNAGLFGGGAPSTLIQVTDIINQALRIAGIMKAPGRGASQEQLAEGLLVLNTMLDSLSIDRLSTGYAYPRTVLNVNAGQQDYFIGVNATDPTPGNVTWNVPRPPRIDYAGIIYLGNPAQPLEIPMRQLTYQGWSQVYLKTTPTTLPLQFYYEPEFPNGVIHLWPAPTVNVQIALYTWQLLTAFLSTSSTATLPPGYLKAIVYNLAKDLNDRYPNAVMKPNAFVEAASGLAMVRRLNVPFFDTHCDPAVTSTDRPYNWIVDSSTTNTP